MPHKRQSKKTKRGGNKTPTAVPHLSIVPNSKNIVMTYNAQQLVSEGAANLGGAWYFRLNSVFDPNATGTGASAIGYSTWSTLFYNYKVKRVTARITTNYNGSSGSMGRITLVPTAFQAVLPADPTTWPLLRSAQTRTISHSTNGGKNVADYVITYDLAKIAGVTQQQYKTDMDFSGQVGSDPLRQIFLAVCVQGLGSGVVGTSLFSVMLSYEVEWFNPIPMQ
jgi:hypothetical protein